MERELDELVVVTGAGGFIGGWLVADLVAGGHRRVRAVDHKPFHAWHQHLPGTEAWRLDLRRPDACAEALRGAGIVYHLAADMGGMGFIANHKSACMLSAVIDAHLLEAARDAGCRRFFYASTACVYPQNLQDDPDVHGLREDDAYPADPEDGYGWQKLFGERLCRHFREDFGLETRVARYHNVYGPHGTWRGGREKAPAAICRKVAEAVQSGRHEIEIWGDGRQTRSFTWIGDCIHGTRAIAESDESEPLNLGSDRLVSIDALVSQVEAIAGVTLERRYRLDAPRGVAGRNSDNDRIKSALGWAPTTPLEVGLEPTYRWIARQVEEATA
ncbi:MAG TPA: NAD-dependent epimerase/dehydratase family protein [Myxococcota bacterium]|nr:NAD-dependent epimerase/dehydratase family protein [Myxococcota bacterium]